MLIKKEIIWYNIWINLFLLVFILWHCYFLYKFFFFFMDYWYFFELRNQELLKQQVEYNQMIVLFKKAQDCIKKGTPENNFNKEFKENDNNNLNNAYWTSEEFKKQWCFMSKDELRNFCLQLMQSKTFTNEFKCEVLDALIGILIDDYDHGVDCLQNLIFVKHLYHSWKVLNGIN